ncbi:integrase [Komagataeibacter intermedius AF2]|uniref:IS21 family transposase ISMac9 n=4 Tax=Acetobacteraceae TaxID=433 RepID=A0A6S6PX27_ACEAC|nr:MULTISPECIES: IS21 family transposase [Acetobacteraceae]KDU94526.1 integrase [Komagataeibacter rhaeticus AF1]KPH85253.1 integrase [Komagataeibacter intermedius AF2]BCI69142.1 IS21 family transposase ISMac9 [Acetobacter aceti]KDU97270.1 integrase [Komagataeibacter rhaeticus AF1]KPH88048.1 integrase [Komagataeibacter intermedius AF2]
MIQELKRQGLSISAIARQTGLDRKTVKKYLANGLETPAYAPRKPVASAAEPYRTYLLERMASYPGLSSRRLHREIRDMGYDGAYSSLTEYLRQIRPPLPRPYERRFETGAGVQAQVDFAEFQTVFTGEPGIVRKVWLFSMVLGHSRWLWGRFCPNQGLETVMRCHIAAFEAMAGCCTEILYDRMKTAVIGEDDAGVVTYNASLVALLAHYGSAPRACQPYRAKTKGKVERPFRYIRQDFFLGRSFHDLDDLNAQFDVWRADIANARAHATTGRIVQEHFAQEQPHLHPLPALRYDAVLSVERRISREGMVAVAGNYYSVPDTARRRVVEIQHHTHEVLIFEEGKLIARHPVLEGKNRKRIEPGHRKAPPVQHAEMLPTTPAVPILQRPLAFYGAVGERLANINAKGTA